MKRINLKINFGDMRKRLTGLCVSQTRELLDQRHQWLLSIVIIVLINLVGLFLYARLDLTRNGAYSLSRISKNVVRSLESPLTVKVFFSNDLPAPYNSVYRYLADILEEYSQYGGRRFRYEFVDVEKHKEAAADFGVQPVQVREIKNDRVSTRSAYMGLAIIHGDLIENISSITEPEGIEYRITTLIQKMNGKVDAMLRLGSPIGVTLYASSGLPIAGMQNLSERIASIVKKSNERNYGKLQYKYVDPDSERAAMELADVYGIPRLKWPAFATMDGRRVNPGEGMIGIVVEHGDRFETVHILSRTMLGQFAVGGLEDLENKINSAIDNIISINPRIGYITGHGEKDIQNQNQRDGAAALRELLSDMYELRVIDLTKDEIPTEIRTIIINGPRSEFSREELFKIDQFLMNGKSALFLIDSFAEMQAEGQNMFMREPMVLPVNTGLEALLAHYGIIVNRDIVLDQSCYRTNLRGFGEQSLYFAPLIDAAGLSRENAITRYLKRIIFLKSSSISFAADRESGPLLKLPLVSSSEMSWLMKGRISFMPWTMSPPPAQQMSTYVLAALLSGELTSYFAEEAPAPAGDAKTAKGAPPLAFESSIKKSVKPASIIVAGSSEITTPSVIDNEGKNPNAVFFHNMIDYRNGNFDVPEMRSKGLELNPLRESSDAAKLLLKLFNILIVPLLAVIAGLVVWRLRAMRTRRIMARFAQEARDE